MNSTHTQHTVQEAEAKPRALIGQSQPCNAMQWHTSGPKRSRPDRRPDVWLEV